jgi:hypothetical protein
MPVPINGTITMLGLAREKRYDNYASTSSPSPPISLADLFLGGDFFGSGVSYETTNTNSVSYPEPDTLLEFEVNGSTPLEMSAWYGYDHDYAVSCGTQVEFFLAKNTGPFCEGPTKRYYANNSNWLSATQLYTGILNSCTPAPSGWYYYPAGGSPSVRYWDGNSFTNTTGCA